MWFRAEPLERALRATGAGPARAAVAVWAARARPELARAVGRSPWEPVAVRAAEQAAEPAELGAARAAKMAAVAAVVLMAAALVTMVEAATLVAGVLVPVEMVAVPAVQRHSLRT